MYRLAGKPLRTFVQDRHDRIAKALAEAAALRKQAEGQLAEYQQKVQNVEAEVTQLLRQVQAEAEADKARIIAAAEAQARRLKEDASRQIEAEVAAARAELRRGVVGTAMQAAETLLKGATTTEDRRKMTERYVESLETRGQGQGQGSA
jgi:F-type H+-transporting ATPase subunit b